MRLVLADVSKEEETLRKAPLMVRKGYICSKEGAAVSVRKDPETVSYIIQRISSAQWSRTVEK